MLTYGKVFVETSASAQSFMDLIQALDLTPPVLIKPNWGTAICYTEAEILDWVLSAVQRPAVVIESAGWARNEETLLGKDPGGLTKANLRRGERWFLEHSGIDRVLARHQVEYINLTEEKWAGRLADPASIRQAVEAKYPPVQLEEMYAQVPERLYELRGGSLLSLAKYRLVFDPIGVTFSIKNLFGLIPGPSRGKFHGKDYFSRLDQSIVDINKIYRSLFRVKGIVEGVFTAGDGRDASVLPKTLAGRGIAFASQDTVSLDAFAAVTGGRDPETVGHLQLAAQHFGIWDARTCDDARRSGVRIID